MGNQPTNDQIGEALQSINAKLQEAESLAESMLPSRPSDDELNVVAGVMEARIQVRKLLRSITPAETFLDIFSQSLKDASQPRDQRQS